MKQLRAFTLIEVIVTLAVITMVAAGSYVAGRHFYRQYTEATFFRTIQRQYQHLRLLARDGDSGAIIFDQQNRSVKFIIYQQQRKEIKVAIPATVTLRGKSYVSVDVRKPFTDISAPKFNTATLGKVKLSFGLEWGLLTQSQGT